MGQASTWPQALVLWQCVFNLEKGLRISRLQSVLFGISARVAVISTN